MKKINIQLSGRNYSILVGRNLLMRVGTLIKSLHLGAKVLVVTNKKVGGLYLASVQNSLKSIGFTPCPPYLCPYGDERDKSPSSLIKLWQHMAKAGLERTSTVIALGGGVVGDLAGFAAATYMRGISVIQIPTTLLAQVDASIGGKTALDLPSAKNIVGAFYQPRMVIADIETLAKLATSCLEELRNGFSEVIKYAVIEDTALFELLEKKLGRFFKKIEKEKRFGKEELSFLETVVWRSAKVKAKIVEEDERETKGKRLILNYGHTFAHAFEAASGYKMPHGQAVAFGMVCAARLARLRGKLRPGIEARQNCLIRQAGLQTKMKGRQNADLWIRAMMLDKKKKDGKLRFILPQAIGKVKVVHDVSLAEIRRVLINVSS